MKIRKWVLTKRMLFEHSAPTDPPPLPPKRPKFPSQRVLIGVWGF